MYCYGRRVNGEDILKEGEKYDFFPLMTALTLAEKAKCCSPDMFLMYH